MSETLQAAWPYAAAVLVVLGAVALGALIVVFIRLAQVLKNANKSVDELNELVAKSNKELQPALERIDPMMEKATLTIDTLNLEMLRVDAILEDIETITDAADKTVTTVEKAATVPTDAVAGIAEKVRGRIGTRSTRGAHSPKKFVYPGAKKSAAGKKSADAEPTMSSALEDKIAKTAAAVAAAEADASQDAAEIEDVLDQAAQGAETVEQTADAPVEVAEQATETAAEAAEAELETAE